MSYQIPYEAEFDCPKGHRFTAPASPFQEHATARCPICMDEWIADNVPDGHQATLARVAPRDGWKGG